jgi:proliferating cell nuclear antigen
MPSFTVETARLNQFTSSLSTILDEVVLEFEDDHLSASGVDPANVAMVFVTLQNTAFDNFDGEVAQYGITLSKLSDGLSLAEKGAPVSLSHDDEAYRLVFSGSGLTYNMGYMAPDSVRQSPGEPNVEWPVSLLMDADSFQRGITAADMVADHLTLNVSDDTFRMQASGDTDDVVLELDEDDGITFEEAGEEVSSILSLDYLKDIFSGIPTDATLELNLGESVPLRLTTPFADEQGYITYVLAPRIQSD